MILDKVKQLYPTHQILGIEEVYYHKGGWKHVKVLEGSSENKIASWIMFYRGWGATRVSFILRDKELGKLIKPDFLISELI